ncbi:MAG: hypothetical protein IT334_10920 [Thermomicrobiales bacterium]|nr:hypothetical protein [Thermomicrobiales bacterium]
MRRIAALFAMFALLASSFVAAAQEGFTGYSNEILSKAGYPDLFVTVGPSGLEAPDTLEAGFYYVTLSAEVAEQVAYMNIVIPPAGLTDDEVNAQLLEAGNGDVVRHGWNFIGGTNTPNPGQTASFVLELKEGEYLIGASYYSVEANGADEVMLTSPLTVTARVSDDIQTVPEATVKVEMTDELRYIVTPDPVAAGPQVWEITNTGVHHSHHVVMVGVPEGTTAEQIISEAQSMFAGTPAAGPGLFAQFTPGGYAALQSGGNTTWVEFDLTPGTWALICFIMEDGVFQPHLLEGMVTVFTVA